MNDRTKATGIIAALTWLAAMLMVVVAIIFQPQADAQACRNQPFGCWPTKTAEITRTPKPPTDTAVPTKTRQPPPTFTAKPSAAPTDTQVPTKPPKKHKSATPTATHIYHSPTPSGVPSQTATATPLIVTATSSACGMCCCCDCPPPAAMLDRSSGLSSTDIAAAVAPVVTAIDQLALWLKVCALALIAIAIVAAIGLIFDAADRIQNPNRKIISNFPAVLGKRPDDSNPGTQTGGFMNGPEGPG